MENNKSKAETITVVDKDGYVVSIEFVHDDGVREKYVFIKDKKDEKE